MMMRMRRKRRVITTLLSALKLNLGLKEWQPATATSLLRQRGSSLQRSSLLRKKKSLPPRMVTQVARKLVSLIASLLQSVSSSTMMSKSISYSRHQQSRLRLISNRNV